MVQARVHERSCVRWNISFARRVLQRLQNCMSLIDPPHPCEQEAAERDQLAITGEPPRSVQRIKCQIAVAHLNVRLRQLNIPNMEFRIENRGSPGELDRCWVIASVEFDLRGKCN